jgi:biotin/methionine sulfoxide reductase
MLSSQPTTRLHSQMDQGPVSRADKIRGREAMLIAPADAEARGIADGDVVRVFNDRGQVLAGARVSDGIRPGVIHLPTGAWYDPVEPGSGRSLDKHGNPNVLTQDKGTSKLGQGPSAQSALVEVERWDGELPEITAFAPPPTA